MNTRQAPRAEELRWIDVLLEEVHGGPAAADQPQRRRPLLAAAIVLLGVSAVVAAMLVPQREALQPARQPVQRLEPQEPVVEAKDEADLKALLATLRSVRVRCRTIASIDPHRVSFVPDPRSETVIREPAVVQAWAREMTASVGKAITLQAIGHSVELRCTLADGRMLVAGAVMDPVLGLFFGSGSEGIEPTPALAGLLRAAFAESEREARRGHDAANLAELAKLPESQQELTCPALTGAQVRTWLAPLPALRTLTLVAQESAMPDRDTLPALAELRSLHELALVGPGFDGAALAALRPLRLRRLTVQGWTGFGSAAMRELAAWNALEELILIDVPAAGDPAALSALKSFRVLTRLGLDAQDLGDACIAELLTTRLQVLRLRGGAPLTGKGIAQLADLPSLRELELCGVAGTQQSVPVLGQVPLINRLFARGSWLADADADELGKLRQLHRLDLRNTGIGPEGGARLHQQLPGCELALPEGSGSFSQGLTGKF